MAVLNHGTTYYPTYSGAPLLHVSGQVCYSEMICSWVRLLPRGSPSPALHPQHRAQGLTREGAQHLFVGRQEGREGKGGGREGNSVSFNPYYSVYHKADYKWMFCGMNKTSVVWKPLYLPNRTRWYENVGAFYFFLLQPNVKMKTHLSKDTCFAPCLRKSVAKGKTATTKWTGHRDGGGGSWETFPIPVLPYWHIF